ncbi:MAG: acetate--CoA ligase family protein [Xanthomonadales bacterium]|nr:acetate--CoA ligase family protein [Xanthomonadales bacterium]
MINQALLDPHSIVVVGGSNDLHKPGGKVLKNIIDGAYAGDLKVVNPKQSSVQGVACVASLDELDEVELAILSIPARFCPAAVHTLATEKDTRAFIILSAGFSEEGAQGKDWEEQIVRTVNSVNGCLLGPNCIGLINNNYRGVFTTPIPVLDENGCDLVSSSGATAVFLLEAGISMGLKFANVFSVGNSAQTGVEDVLEHMDAHFDAKTGSRSKLLYLESVFNPQKLLKHASSLVRKGARIAAIKAGRTEAGSRAAASHTGALTNPDSAVSALFKKAGIVQCRSRQELLSVAAVFSYPELKGKNIAVITHAGGPAVMLTDALSDGGLNVPALEGPDAEQLLSQLNPGSSVANPIDFLATGTAKQLGTIIDHCEQEFDQVDAMVVIFGSPGLFDVTDAYAILRSKMVSCSKPIYPVLPSVINARAGIEAFQSAGYANFPDEVVLARALCAVAGTPAPAKGATAPNITIDRQRIRNIVDTASDGFLPPDKAGELLDAAGIPRVQQQIITVARQLEHPPVPFDFPVAMKVVGPVHKTDVGGVVLDVESGHDMQTQFDRLMRIEGAVGVLLQPMTDGIELFVGVKREAGFGHLLVCGFGGVMVEVMNDVSACLVPVSESEASKMIRRLQAYPLIQGLRGREGVCERLFSEIIQRVSALVETAPEISEMDINPLMGSGQTLLAVDTRTRIEKQLAETPHPPLPETASSTRLKA